LLRQCEERFLGVPANNGQGPFPRTHHVLIIFANRDKTKLLPRKAGDISPANDSAASRFFGEVVNAHPGHKHIVHIKEGQNRVLT
jgi:hypothetical protein